MNAHQIEPVLRDPYAEQVGGVVAQRGVHLVIDCHAEKLRAQVHGPSPTGKWIIHYTDVPG